MLFIRLLGLTDIDVQNAQFEDSDSLVIPKLIGHKDSLGVPERFRDSNWHGMYNYDFTIPVWKCHEQYVSFDDFNIWLEANNGRPITFQLIDMNEITEDEEVITQHNGFMTLNSASENLNDWTVGLTFKEVT